MLTLISDELVVICVMLCVCVFS